MKEFCDVMKLSQMWNKIIERYGKIGKKDHFNIGYL